jgi:hypothetical protein
LHPSSAETQFDSSSSWPLSMIWTFYRVTSKMLTWLHRIRKRYGQSKFNDQLGPDYKGRRAIISKALYGLRLRGRSFRYYLAFHLREMGFTSLKADPDLWMRAALKSNGDKIYEYVISYVDDLVFQGVDPKGFMDALGQRFTLKAGSIKERDTYLGVDVKKFRIPNSDDPDKVRWAFESTSYVKKAISDLEK